MNGSLKIKILNLPIRRFQCSGLVMLFAGLSSGFAAQQTNAFVRPDYSSFKLVIERNIFNSKRSRDTIDTSRSPDRTPRARDKTESFALVGTMNQGAGPIAFFEGSRSDYRKVLKDQDTIAGFKVAHIQPSSVKLASSTNEIELRLGMQLVREEEGPWRISVRPESLEAPPVSTSSSRSSSRSNSRSSDSASSRTSDNPPSLSDVIGNLPFNPDALFPGAQPGNQSPAAAANNAPAPNAPASGEDMLTILRRRREAENQ